MVNMPNRQGARSAEGHGDGSGGDPPDESARLMGLWAAGDEGAFERLVQRHSGSVYALITRFLGAHPSREDMVQEVFLRVVRSRDRYEPRARFTTWLYRIVFNLCVNEGERAGRRKHLSLDRMRSSDDDAGQVDFEDERVEQPVVSMQRADRVKMVRDAIAELPEAQRMALVLAKYEEMPYVEIARVLDSSEKAVKSLMHRARTSLRERLSVLLQEDLA
ncbi:MAG: RNA polymerase sigma-70 factor (ECF subfamily) [Chlamydiales bacterium]|jgi:RNA polymerase sigma-70 factor (ECF subfamily)